MLTLIAILIIWTIIQALFGKNPGPLLILVILYVLLSAVAEMIY